MSNKALQSQISANSSATEQAKEVLKSAGGKEQEGETADDNRERLNDLYQKQAIVNANGELTLTGNNSYTGGTTVNGGTLSRGIRPTTVTASGVVVQNDAELQRELDRAEQPGHGRRGGSGEVARPMDRQLPAAGTINRATDSILRRARSPGWSNKAPALSCFLGLTPTVAQSTSAVEWCRLRIRTSPPAGSCSTTTSSLAFKETSATRTGLRTLVAAVRPVRRRCQHYRRWPVRRHREQAYSRMAPRATISSRNWPSTSRNCRRRAAVNSGLRSSNRTPSIRPGTLSWRLRCRRPIPGVPGTRQGDSNNSRCSSISTIGSTRSNAMQRPRSSPSVHKRLRRRKWSLRLWHSNRSNFVIYRDERSRISRAQRTWIRLPDE